MASFTNLSSTLLTSPPPSLSASNHHRPTLPSRPSHYPPRLSLRSTHNPRRRISLSSRSIPSISIRSAPIVAAAEREPLKVMISGAPASGKGTQCELITKKYGLVHIAAGDLLRAEVAAQTENGRRAKDYMEKGMLVPDEIVVTMVKDRLLQQDAQEKGWLLDGYPRSLSQAKALVDLGIQPDLFILLDVSEESLIERVVGRRLDPVTGKIYHLKYSPPENEEIAARLTQRFDDTEDKVKLRLKTHHENVEAVLAVYKDFIYKVIALQLMSVLSQGATRTNHGVNGNGPKEQVFAQIDKALSSLLEEKSRSDLESLASGTTH